jgi:hypothetical protein
MAPHEATIPPEPQVPPRLRRDLEFTHRQAAGATEVIACDPVSGRYFRAGELEAAHFTLLDGDTPLEVVAGRLTQEFPGLPAEEVTDFVAQLDRIGFLEGAARVGARPRTPLYRRLLYAQVRLANPDRLFARLLPLVGWLYHPAGWALVTLLFLVAGAVAAIRGEELVQQSAAVTPGFWGSACSGYMACPASTAT